MAFSIVDGTNPAPVEVGSLSHYLHGFVHPRWLFWISKPSTVVYVVSCCSKKCPVPKQEADPWVILMFDVDHNSQMVANCESRGV